MKYIFNNTEKITAGIKGRKILLMLDYDGTVVPIAKTPSEAVLSDASRKIFNDIAKEPHIKLAFISGRSVAEIRKMAGIKGIFYAGNHGLEIEGPKTAFVHEKAKKTSSELRSIFDALRKKLCSFKGVLIEDKVLSISVHFRLADPHEEKNIKALVKASADKNRFRLSGGKKVIEIRPKEKWNKGNAAKFLLKKLKGCFPVYIGDDKTDEDAFKALKGLGLTVFVGDRKKSAAGYYLNDTKEVISFVRFLGNRGNTA